MEDGQIGTVKFVGPNQEERCVVQLYVNYRNNLYLIFRPSISLFFLFFYFFLLCYERCGALMLSTLDSGLRGSGFEPWTLCCCHRSFSCVLKRDALS